VSFNRYVDGARTLHFSNVQKRNETSVWLTDRWMIKSGAEETKWVKSNNRVSLVSSNESIDYQY